MLWDEKRYHSLNYYLKSRFNEKIYKVSLDGGFTCPNRDGTISKEGCIFCSENGSGEFAGDKNKSIYNQIEQQLELISKKFPEGKVIAYFQNFTNTYGKISKLKKIYEEALKHPRVIGIAIATRPDCISEEVIKLLSELNKKTFLWVELGLQTTNPQSAILINRGWKLEVLDHVIRKLNQHKIKSVAHIILGLPYESEEDMINSVKYIVKQKIWGVKFHLLYIVKGTILENYYNKNKFKVLTKEEYIQILSNCLKELDKNIVIHRLTGDGKRETLVEPKWSLNKREVLNSIDKFLKEKNINQGMTI